MAQQECLSLRLEGDEAGITRPGLETMLEKYDAAAHEEAGLITAEAAEIGRDAEVSVMLTAGDTGLITGCRLLAGSFGLSDPGECMISSAAALALFGSAEGAGLTVLAEGREWYVRGVFKSDQPFILLPAGKDKLLTNLQFQVSGSGDNRAEAEQACFQYGVTGRAAVIDYGFFAALARLLVWLPFVVFLCILRGKTRKSPAAVKRNVFHYVSELLFWGGILFVFSQAVRFPSEYIPAKWSDFGFWAVKWKEAVEAVATLCVSSQLKDRLLTGRLAACVLSSAAASVLLYPAVGNGEKTVA